MYEVKQLSPEEMEALRAQFPYTDVKEYQVLDDGISLGFFSTADEAALEADKWRGREVIDDIIKDRLPGLIDALEQLGDQYGIDSTEVHSMLREAI